MGAIKPRALPASTVQVIPAWQSQMADSGDTTKFGPNAWNAPRVLAGGNPGDLLSRDPNAATGGTWIPPGPRTIATLSAPISGPPDGAAALLWSLVLPPNQLAKPGDALLLTAWGKWYAAASAWNFEIVVQAASGASGPIALTRTQPPGGDLGWLVRVALMRRAAQQQTMVAESLASGRSAQVDVVPQVLDLTQPLTLGLQFNGYANSNGSTPGDVQGLLLQQS